MISHNDETVFRVNFAAKRNDSWVNIFDSEMFFNYLPRTKDIVNIDSCYMKVLTVEYDYKFQFKPTLRVEELGHFEEYSRNHL